MTYRMEVDFAPAYELVVSLYGYCQKNLHRGMDLGSPWVREVRGILHPTFAAQLDDVRSDRFFHGLDLLIHQCPGDRTATGFLHWLAGLSAGELFERLSPWAEVPADETVRRDQAVEVLGEWEKQYFRGIDPAILDALAVDAEEKRQMQADHAAMDLLEIATNGVRYEEKAGLRRLLLVPQYHITPHSTSWQYGSWITSFYMVDALPAAPGTPSPSLLRLTRSLADESRLRILRYLAATRSFAEVVQFAGLSKSTVHHHLVALRAAGLITVRGEGNITYYRLREEVVAELGSLLLAFFKEGAV